MSCGKLGAPAEHQITTMATRLDALREACCEEDHCLTSSRLAKLAHMEVLLPFGSLRRSRTQSATNKMQSCQSGFGKV